MLAGNCNPGDSGGDADGGGDANGNPLERIRQLLAERADAYAYAHHAVATDGRTPEDVVKSILHILEEGNP